MKLIKPLAVVAVLCALLFSGCTTPMKYTDKEMAVYDNDTSYRIDDFNGGFTITVYYSRYQMIPESDAINAAGKSALTNIAHEVAESKGQEIQPINEQRIRMSMGRNGFSGITSWSGTAPVYYKKKEG